MKTLTVLYLIQFAFIVALFPLTTLTLRDQNSTIGILNADLGRVEEDLSRVRVKMDLIGRRLAKVEDPDRWGILVNPNRPIDPGAEDLKRLVQAYNDPAVPDEEIKCMLEELGK